MVKRKNSWQDAYNTGTAELDLGDGIVIPLPVSGVLPGNPGPPGAGVPAGGAAKQLVRKNSAGTTTEWVSPDKALVGLDNVDNTSDEEKPLSALAIQALGLKVKKGEIVVNPRDFGAKGDGVTDDTEFIQLAVNSLNASAGYGGGTVLFDYGFYRVTSTITISKHGTHLTSAGAFTANIMPDAAMTGPVFKFAIPNTYFRGPRVSNLRLYMNGSTASGIRFESAYDNVMLENVYIDNLVGAARGFEFVPAAGSPSTISQTITAINCWASGARTGNVFTGQAWYLEDVQESVFTSCKGFGGGETSGTAWYVKGSRGVQFYGCSAAFANNGWVLDSSVRAMMGITIDAPTLEGIANTLTTTGANQISFVALRNPRAQFSGVSSAGPVTVDWLNQSTLETHYLDVSLGSNCTIVQVVTDNLSKVTDAGVNTTIVQWKNATRPYTVGPQFAVESANTPYVRLAVTGRTGYWQDQWGASSSTDGGFLKRYWDGAAWRNSHAIDAGGTRHRFYVWNGTAAVESLAVTASPAAQKAGLWLMVNDGTTTTLKQAELGPLDSAGTGYRSIRVAN